jgi:hypothetical protein
MRRKTARYCVTLGENSPEMVQFGISVMESTYKYTQIQCSSTLRSYVRLNWTKWEWNSSEKDDSLVRTVMVFMQAITSLPPPTPPLNYWLHKRICAGRGRDYWLRAREPYNEHVFTLRLPNSRWWVPQQGNGRNALCAPQALLVKKNYKCVSQGAVIVLQCIFEVLVWHLTGSALC